MRLDYGASSFIIVGGWNPNIVNDMWIRQNLLDHPNEQVDMGFKGMEGNSAGIPTVPAAMFRNVGLAVLDGRLELNLMHNEDFIHIENCVRRLCEAQSNTLVSGYGINLVYIENMVRDELINLFGAHTLSQISFNQIYRYFTYLDGIITNIAVEVNKQNSRSAIVFNFHFNVDDLSTLIQRMAEYPIASLNDKAIQFFSNYYGFRLES